MPTWAPVAGVTLVTALAAGCAARAPHHPPEPAAGAHAAPDTRPTDARPTRASYHYHCVTAVYLATPGGMGGNGTPVPGGRPLLFGLTTDNWFTVARTPGRDTTRVTVTIDSARFATSPKSSVRTTIPPDSSAGTSLTGPVWRGGHGLRASTPQEHFALDVLRFVTPELITEGGASADTMVAQRPARRVLYDALPAALAASRNAPDHPGTGTAVLYVAHDGVVLGARARREYGGTMPPQAGAPQGIPYTATDSITVTQLPSPATPAGRAEQR